MKALVLSGGGSKGSYQIGVWRALIQLGIKFDIVTGTSSGAINGALITQNTYFRAVHVWKNLNYKNIFGSEFNNSSKLSTLYKGFVKNFINDGGTEVKELQELINKNLKINRIYRSKMNYGLVTYNLTTKKPELLQKKDIPKEKLGDYILASASCFPAFKTKKINGQDYVDGGYYDNLPINLAIDMGADEVIVVDLHEVGLKRITKKKIKQTIISPRNNLSNFLVFDAEYSRRNMKYGYNDTMKEFGKLEGNKYTFRLHEIDKFKKKYEETYKYIVNKIFNTKEALQEFEKRIDIPKDIRNNLVIKLIEDTGYKFKIDDTRIYTCKKFNQLLKHEVRQELKNKEKNSVLDIYKLLVSGQYDKVKKKVITRPFDLIKAIYIYTIFEV
ncbi:MAG: patatin-like phospholipase family protein [Bacilli bacterium]|nr:patatin-like phospholipase family protein [Bacilli bacterium]